MRSDSAKEFYFFVRHLKISPHDYVDLTELQKAVLIYQWNEEAKEQERQAKKGGRKRGKKRH